MRIESTPAFAPVQRPATSRPPAAPAAAPAPAPAAKGYLSAEEINYFAELERLGPLTYGRNGTSGDRQAPAPVLGTRLDVRA